MQKIMKCVSLLIMLIAFINFSCSNNSKPTTSSDTTSNYTIYDTASVPVAADSIIKKEVSPKK